MSSKNCVALKNNLDSSPRSYLGPHNSSAMGQDPKVAWRKLQQTLSSAQQRGGNPFGGNPRNVFGGAGALILLGGGAVLLTNSLFNGDQNLYGGYMVYIANIRS